MPDSNQRLVSEVYVEHSLSNSLDTICKLVTKSVNLLSEFKEIRDHKNRMLNMEEEKEPVIVDEEISSSIHGARNAA